MSGESKGRARSGRRPRAVTRRLGGIALLIPLLSALSTPAIPLGFRILLVALWVTAIARPDWAITAVIVIVPFASWLFVAFDAPPVRSAEALVLVVLSGAIIAAARPPRTPLEGQRPALGPAAGVFSAVTCASAAVMLQVMQAGTHAPWPFLRDVLVFLTRDYLVGPPGSFAGVADAALLLEGIGLAFLVARHARDGVARPAQLFAAIGLAGALAAALTLKTFVTTALEAASVREFFWRLAFSRMTVHVADANAAGSFFAMTAWVALAFAANRRHPRAPRRLALGHGLWLSAAALILSAMWITGSRMAVLAVIGTLGVVAMTVSGPWRKSAVLGTARRLWLARALKGAMAGAIVAGALLLAALAIGLDPRPSPARSTSRMLSMRADFMVTGLRMMASAPIFGVGVGRYFEMSGRFMPPSIYWFYFHENAHNNFLQIGGELGLAGLAAFVWLLAVAAIRIVRGAGADPGDRLLVGALAGLGAFVATWMTSHPMLVAEVAYPFWMLLGVALARADGNAQPPLASPDVPSRAASIAGRRLSIAGLPLSIAGRPLLIAGRPLSIVGLPLSIVGRPFRGAHVLVGAVIAVLAVSVPVRAKRQMATIDFGRFSFGFYDWEQEDGQRFRWTSRRATFFIPLNARELHLPVRAIHVGSNLAPTDVSIAIGGRVFHRLRLPNDEWVNVRMRLPLLPEDEAFQRIDIITEPTWSPAALFGGRSDVRVLGVQVGEPVTGP